MIVADTSALVSLATADSLHLFLDEFDVHTTETVLDELEETAEFDDIHGKAADAILANADGVSIHEIDDQGIESSRIDRGEASCIRLVRATDAEFLVTDDLGALPELQTLTDTRVAISPIVLRALVERGALEPDEAERRLDRLAERRDWLGAPIYRRAKNLLEFT